ncbi:MAG: 6-phosphogluconolactonase, partial [Clostridia bacterium]|nr:6-phosphogluconolactonase [Clostridia bacterium]
MLLKKIKTDKLDVEVYSSRPDMGKNAAVYAAGIIKDLLSKKDEINMIFAAAPSQNEFLASLIEDKDIDWSRINAFHMDEYIGLSKDAPQGFGNFLKDKIFGKVPFKEVNYINSEADAKEECARYGALLSSRKIDMVCMGIGENGHIAFNDPGVADFNDKVFVKKALLDEVCRNQQ